MCNLVTMKASVDEVASAFRARRPPATNAAPGDVWKGGTGFVVREVAGEREMAVMHWGFPRHSVNKRTGAPNRPSPVNNARDDKLMSPFGMWREWFMAPAQRCLIPFTAFAEAEGAAGAMTKTWIRVADQPLAAWAGLWRPTDEWGDCYTGVMIDATAELFDIHDRMPVILRPDEHDSWLHAPAEEAMALVRQYPAALLGIDRSRESWSERGGNPSQRSLPLG